MLLKPLITEKTTREASLAKYTFLVSSRSRKEGIADQVEKLFNVQVDKIETVTIPKKTRRTGRLAKISLTPSGKKAIVTLKKGQKIDLFEIPRESDTEK